MENQVQTTVQDRPGPDPYRVGIGAGRVDPALLKAGLRAAWRAGVVPTLLVPTGPHAAHLRERYARWGFVPAGEQSAGWLLAHEPGPAAAAGPAGATRRSRATGDGTAIYQIRIKGHLGRPWADWFGGLTIALEDNGDTLVTGPVDQAALHGVLRKVRDLGMPLLSVIL